MSATTSSSARTTGRWHVIGSALDGWGRTLRLCLILFVASVPPSVIYLGVSWMVHRG